MIWAQPTLGSLEMAPKANSTHKDCWPIGNERSGGTLEISEVARSMAANTLVRP